MNSLVKIQSNESCIRNGVDYSSLPPPTRKEIRNISRRMKRIRCEPKDIIKAKWKSHVNMLLTRFFPAVEYRDNTNIENGTSSAEPSILESVRLVSFRALNIDPVARPQPESSDAEEIIRMQPIRCETVSKMAPLLKRKNSLWSKVPKRERFLVHFRRNTHKFQENIKKLKEFSETHLLPKRETSANVNLEEPEKKRPRTADF